MKQHTKSTAKNWKKSVTKIVPGADLKNIEGQLNKILHSADKNVINAKSQITLGRFLYIIIPHNSISTRKRGIRQQWLGLLYVFCDN